MSQNKKLFFINFPTSGVLLQQQKKRLRALEKKENGNKGSTRTENMKSIYK
jgi:hypothetical protein